MSNNSGLNEVPSGASQISTPFNLSPEENESLLADPTDTQSLADLSLCQKFSELIQGVSRVKNNKHLNNIICDLQEHMFKLSERVAELEAQQSIYRQWQESLVSGAHTASKTYAAVAKLPPKIPTPVRIVSNNSHDSSVATKGLLKAGIASSDINIKGIRELKDGAISVLCNSLADASNLKAKISTCANLKLVDLQKSQPAFSFCVPDKLDACDDTALINVLRSKNPNIFSPAPENSADQLKIAHKRDARNGKGTVVVIRVPPSDYASLHKTKKIFLNWECVSIRELPPSKQCRNCLRFGHKASVCRYLVNGTKLSRCPSCTDHHADCNSNSPVCAICQDANTKASAKGWNTRKLDTNHRADSKSCPSFKRAIEEARLRVDYGQD